MATPEDILEQIEKLDPYPPSFHNPVVVYRGEDTFDPERETASLLVRNQLDKRKKVCFETLQADTMSIIQEVCERLFGDDRSALLSVGPFRLVSVEPFSRGTLSKDEWLRLRAALLTCPTSLRLLSDLQHYGCPTPLIDATRDPRVALYFACSNKNDSDGVVFCGDLLKSPFSSEVQDITPDMTSIRAQRQKSVLLFPKGFSIPLSYWHNHVVVPAAVKSDILHMLRDMEITENSLFPDIYGSASYLRCAFAERNLPS